MADRDTIISYVQSKGIVLPIDIAKLINSSILLASAYLSELVSAGLIKISNVKVGGSPLYYASGHEAKLDQYISKLHEKEQKAVNLLKQEKVLKDSDLDPVTRVCLRNSKDFAKAIEVVLLDEKQLFWKYHLASKEEIESIIKAKYMAPEKAEIQKEEPKIAKPEEKQPGPGPSKPFQEEKSSQPEPKKEAAKEQEKKHEPEKIIEDAKKKYEPRTEQKKIFAAKLEKQQPSGTFYGKIKEFFAEHSIKVMNEGVIKKNNQFWFIAEVPASIGYITYYCEAKNKKTVSSSDLGEALARAQSKRLPVLFIANGKPNKSVEQMLENEFKNIIIRQI